MPSSTPDDRRVRLALNVLGVSSLAIALMQTVAPTAFVHDIGPFGAPNGHYVRDLATWSAAFGVALLIAARRPSWRPPVIALGIVQGALHLINHIVDAGSADPVATGIFNAVALAALLGVFVWLWTLVSPREATS